MEQLNKKTLNSLVACCNELQKIYEKLDIICDTNNIILVNIFTYLDHILNSEVRSIHISTDITDVVTIETLANIAGQEIVEFGQETKGFIYKGVKFYVLLSEADND